MQLTRWRRRLMIALALAGAFYLGSFAQEQLGISFNLEGLEAFRQWVNDLGWLGPVVFIVLCIVRLFIGLTSHLILILGGLVFGAIGGMIWGSLGLMASAIVLYQLAQSLGADWVTNRFGKEYLTMLERIKRVGAIAIFAITAHPFGILTTAHLAAGLVGLRFSQFVLAIALAAPIRAAPFVFLGTSILDLTLIQSLVIAGAMFLIFGLPLFHPNVRRWIVTDTNA